MENSSSMENVFKQDLRDRINASFGEIIDKEIMKYRSLNPDATSETIVGAIGHTVSSSEKFLAFNSTFISDVAEILYEESCEFDDVFHNAFTNDCHFGGSVSSVNSASIDFLSSDELGKAVESLGSSSPLKQMEALSVFYRLSSLEHITKQSLWADIKMKFHNLMFSDISLLRAGCLKIYIKMLSSPDPQVVCMGYRSLLDFLQKLATSKSDRHLYCSGFVEKVVSLINSFHQRIPFRWLRYPLKNVEDIVTSFLNVIDACYSRLWPIISCVDPGAKWMSSLMHGSASRTILLNALSNHIELFRLTLNDCRDFTKLDYGGEFLICCDDRNCKKMVHNVCFLSHLMKYPDSIVIRNDFNFNHEQNVFSVVMMSTLKLSEVTCFSCFSVVRDVMSKLWNNIFYSNNSALYLTKVFKCFDVHIRIPNAVQVTRNKLCLIYGCFSEILNFNQGINFVFALNSSNKVSEYVLGNICSHLKSIDFGSENSIEPCKCILSSVKSILAIPIFVSVDFNLRDMYDDVLKALLHLSDALGSVCESTPLDNEALKRCVDECSSAIVKYVTKPYGLYKCLHDGYYSLCFSSLIQRMHVNKCNSSSSSTMCACDVLSLMTFLCYTIAFQVNFDEKLFSELIIILRELKMYTDLTDCSASEKNILKSLILVTNEIVCVSTNENISHLDNFTISEINVLQDADYTAIILETFSVLSFNIHVAAFFHTKFDISSLMMNFISQYVMDNGNVIIDDLSLLSNYIIVRLYSIGGPSEIILPPKSLQTSLEVYDWPLVTSYPLFPVHHKEIIHEEEERCDFVDLNLTEKKVWFLCCLKEGKKPSLEFLFKAKFKESIVHQSLDNDLKYTQSLCEESKTNHTGNCSHVEVGIEKFGFKEEIKAGIQAFIRFANTLELWTENSTNDFISLVAKCISIFGSDQTCIYLLIGTIFMASKCDSDATLTFMREHYEKFPMVGIKNRTDASLMELCDLLVLRSLPDVYYAFQMSNMQPSVMYQYWTKQLYWNYLDLNEISNFVALSILFGRDYTIYFFVSVLNHLRQECLKSSHDHSLLLKLKGNSIHGFKTKDHIDFLMNLATEYGELMQT